MWNVSRQLCQKDGADLVVLDTEEKLQYMIEFIRSICKCAENFIIRILKGEIVNEQYFTKYQCAKLLYLI